MKRPGGDQVIPRPSQVWVRPYNPWQNLDLSVLMDVDAVVGKVRQFSERYSGIPAQPDAQVAAVLVGLIDGPNGAEVILTRRSMAMRSHMGEISFPGGRLDADETPRDAALREASEEIDLSPSSVQVVGELPPMSLLTSPNHIVPIVGKVATAPRDVRNDEVERVFTVPLIELARADTYSEELWGSPPRQFQIFFFYLDEETIWGTTARALQRLINIAVLV
jgi:8-oxo-dGTP pyrophosphatase MutT (NUDIX family)